MDEDPANPGRHRVGLWRPEVDVEDNHGDADGEGVKDHGEEDKLAQQRHDKGGGGDDLGEEEEEHGEGEEDGDGEGDFLAAVGGQVEHEDCEEGDAHAGDDQVHSVEQSLSSHGDVEGDVQVGFIATRIKLDISENQQFTIKFIALVTFGNFIFQEAFYVHLLMQSSNN